jgi:hypothetical protein
MNCVMGPGVYRFYVSWGNGMVLDMNEHIEIEIPVSFKIDEMSEELARRSVFKNNGFFQRKHRMSPNVRSCEYVGPIQEPLYRYIAVVEPIHYAAARHSEKVEVNATVVDAFALDNHVYGIYVVTSACIRFVQYATAIVTPDGKVTKNRFTGTEQLPWHIQEKVNEHL